MTHDAADHLYDYHRAEYRRELERRDMEKKMLDGSKTFGVALLLIALGMVAMLCAGCNTTRTVTPTGDTVTETHFDLEAAIAINQMALNWAQLGLDLWQQQQAVNATLTAQEFAAELATRQARIASMQAVIDNLIKIKAAIK
jgi:hypothetical protein